MPRFMTLDLPEGCKRIFIINGPNLNLQGRRNKEIYGEMTLNEIEQYVVAYANTLPEEPPISLSFFQNNHEGVLIDTLQKAQQHYDAVVFNPGAYAHYSIALRDAVEAMTIPVVEVHLSNIYDREEFRHIDVIADVCLDQIVGLGADGYCRALDRILEHGFVDKTEE